MFTSKKMNKYFIVSYNGAFPVGQIPEGATLETVVSSYGISDPSLYKEFDYTDFDPACYNFSEAFTLTSGVVGFDFTKAKQIADITVNVQSNLAASKTLEGLSYDVYIAQAALPPEQRIVKYQAAIDANNAIALETEQREQAIYAATTIEEVNAIVYPPAAS
jgi:hypothetical protein